MIFALKHVLKPSHKWNIPYKVRQLKININTEKKHPNVSKALGLPSQKIRYYFCVWYKSKYGWFLALLY
jgi:hypothetical protein